MSRLPQPGQDNGTWGTILNDFLLQSHAADGSLKSAVVGTSHLQPASVTNNILAPDAVDGTSIADGSISTSQLDTSNSPSNNQLLSYNGTDLTWVNSPVTSVVGQTGAITGTQIANDSALTSKYDLISRNPAPLGARWVALGDSIDKGSDNTVSPARGQSWTMFAGIASHEALHLIYNAGVAGDTTAQMLARFDTDVTPYNPTMVSIGGGRNDIGQSVTLNTFQTNIAAIIAKCTAIGAVPVLHTIPPCTGSPRQTTSDWNNWLRSYALRNRILLSDFYRVLVDPATGNFLSAYNSGDSVHPNEAGYAACGNQFATDLAPKLGPLSLPRVMDALDTSNIMQPANPLWLNTTLSGNTPNGWSLTNSGSMASASILTGDTAILGNWYRMTYSSSASDVTLVRGSGGSFTAGATNDIIAMTGRIRTNLSASPGIDVYVGNGSGSSYAIFSIGPRNIDGRFWITFPIKAGTGIAPRVFVRAGTTGTVDIAEWGAFNLTALGLTSLI